MNPFSFLGNIGGAIGGGAKQVGGMFAKSFKKLGELDGQSNGGGLSRPQMPTLGPGGTGGFAGNQGLPQIGGMARGAEDARAIPLGGQSGLINRTQPQAGSLPQLQRPDMPTLEPIRDSVNINASMDGPVGGSDALGSLLSREANRPAAVEAQQGMLNAPRPIPSVRPPDFLGRKGATMDDTPLNHERYAYDNQYMENGHHPRRWQDIAMTALHGANQGFQATGDWRGALGGAGVGAAGAAINPLMARDFRFNQEQLPRIEASRKELERGQDRSYEMQKRGADLEGSRARTQATIAGMKDPELERRKTEAMISKVNAQAEAARTGKPIEFIDYNPTTGEFRTAFKYPDGHIDYDGRSGDAELKLKGYENQKQIGDARNKAGLERVIQQGKDAFKRTQAQQGGANWRTTYSQSKQDARTDKKIKAQYGDSQSSGVGEYGPAAPPAVGSVPVKRASVADVNEYAKQRGISPTEARAKFEAKGYRVE